MLEPKQGQKTERSSHLGEIFPGMLRIASDLLHWVMDRRCPSCDSVEVRRSARKNLFETALLPFFLTRPFRCETCGNRFFGLGFRRRVPALGYATPMADVQQGLPVLVYGRSKNEEAFREETNLHLLNLRSGLITLGTSVEPGQQLILMNIAAEEDQRCRVAFVGEQHLGRNMIGIQFNWLAQKFCETDEAARPKFYASAPRAFWEQ